MVRFEQNDGQGNRETQENSQREQDQARSTFLRDLTRNNKAVFFFLIKAKNIYHCNFLSLQRNLNSSENKTETATLIDLFKTPRLARKTIILTAFW